MATTAVYPVHVDAALEPHLSRWLWLVKWLLAIPHYIVLGFLWVGFVVTSVVAFFAILFTGRYPRAIFAYNVGVLRWSWRVAYYAYGALGTDRYPPFTLEEVDDYPAHLTIDYPEHLSRGLVLVKWWLLAIPHYIIVGLFVGGGAWASTRSNENWQWSWGNGGLIGILVLISAVILAFTGSYPRSLFDLILAMNRWALRVAAYAGLMTDVYPPFRLDLGDHDPSVMTLQRAPGASAETAPPTTPPATPENLFEPPARIPPQIPAPHAAWTAGRVVALICGALLAFFAVGLLTAGVALTAADHVSRDSGGYLTSPTVTLSSGANAVVSDRLVLEPGGPAWAYPTNVLGTARVRVSPSDPTHTVFVGIAPSSQVETYLAGVRYATVQSIGDSGATYVEHAGTSAVPTLGTPAQQTFWTASVSGTGPQTLTWKPAAGDWTVVVMNADATPGISVETDVAATVPSLGWISLGLVIGGLVVLVAGALLVALPIRSATRHQHEEQLRTSLE